jgi:hypothetical protein
VSDVDDCLLMACELAVLRALELAGKRMRGSSARNVRNGLLQVPGHELHTHMSGRRMSLDELMEGVWGTFELVVPGRPELLEDLDQYVRLLIRLREQHDRERLRPIVARHQ